MSYGSSNDNSAASVDPGLSSSSCGGDTALDQTNLRIAAIFIILVTSLFGTMFPIVSRRVKALKVHEKIYTFVRYFGSGVIIATGFIHLLAPAFAELTAPCLSDIWQNYPFASAIAMCSIFGIFLVELIAHRAGAAYLKKRDLKVHDPHSAGSNGMAHTTHGLHVQGTSTPPLADDIEASTGPVSPTSSILKQASDDEAQHDNNHDVRLTESAMAKIVGVAILEFGVIFHSTIIGLTLAVASGFNTLFVVIVFHQTFEGLGLGSRLAILPLPSRYRWVPYAGAGIYAVITPLGLAIGLGLRTTYDPNSETANIVSGVLDALSAGILIYTGLVELLAHDFIFNREMAVEASNGKVAFAVCSVMTGAGLMALLGRWA